MKRRIDLKYSIDDAGRMRNPGTSKSVAGQAGLC